MGKRMCRLSVAALTLVYCTLLGCSIPTECGWIGGDLRQAEATRRLVLGPPSVQTIQTLPHEVANVQKRAVFVSRLHEDTPLAKSGVCEGDLIVSLDGIPVKSLTSFRRTIDSVVPGSRLTIRTYSDSTYEDHHVTVGQETLDEKGRGYLALGLFLEMQADLFPDPNFNLFGLLGYQRWNNYIDLQSAEHEYAHRVDEDKNTSPSRGWSLYLGPVRIGYIRNIVEQCLFPGKPRANTKQCRADTNTGTLYRIECEGSGW